MKSLTKRKLDKLNGWKRVLEEKSQRCCAMCTYCKISEGKFNRCWLHDRYTSTLDCCADFYLYNKFKSRDV